MSSIIQRQRAAIEQLMIPGDKNGGVPLFEFCKSTEVCLYNLEYRFQKFIYLLGVSRGAGSCSKRWGINVLVFGEAPCVGEPAFLVDRMFGDSSRKSVVSAFAVLLRSPTIKEIARSGVASACAVSCLAVERLQLDACYTSPEWVHRPRSGRTGDQDGFYFVRTSSVAVYVT